jgi:hypothetical protein
MVEKIKDSSDIFGGWLKSELSPIELLILGSFRFLGRGLAFKVIIITQLITKLGVLPNKGVFGRL